MRALFERTPAGAPVRIVYQPVKLGQREGDVFVEVHPDVYGLARDPLPSVLAELLALSLLGLVDYEVLSVRAGGLELVPVPIAVLQRDART